ncbi:MAG: folylpolyglutamate synthase/dihydrofolate synthase family protein [Candidatus Marinimicrobia bacterium]|nr:folylpolyglutamate synthase/dihydrofolate synthase family protein [Candidatus Neomarinimicrobiota bacterium]MDP6614714.1 folylpolyglutamate synthase/dihydrofolate synthase family protein [Candidatus Neomarinimicrobiota bacterium]
MPPSATHHTLTYSDLSSLLKSLYSLQRHGIKLGLEHTYRLLESIGNPHDGLVLIHVAGTNGKGSTCAMISSMLRALGKKVGLYTSPHLLHFNERIRVDGFPISDQEIIMFMNKAEDDIMQIESTFFETTTAMALDHFKNNEVDVAVIETGLGGSLDSTNVINPVLSVITPVSLDHRDILGEDIVKIATEKAGIIKPGVPLILAEQEKKVERLFQKKADQVNSEIQIVKNSMVLDIDFDQNGCHFSFESDLYHLPLIGTHQAYNAAMAVKSVQKYDSTIKTAELQTGLKTVQWPGRLEKVDNFIYYDVAHNQAGISSVIKTIKRLYPNRPLIGLFCLKNDKEFVLIAKSFQDSMNTVYVTTDKNGLLIDSYRLWESLKNIGCKSEPVDTVSAGIARMKLKINQGGIGLIFGSHYIAEEVYKEFEISFDTGKI